MGPASNHPSNGLLLRSDLHTLFDKHLIAVDDSGRLAVSERLSQTAYANMVGVKLTVPLDNEARPHRASLAEHLAALIGERL